MSGQALAQWASKKFKYYCSRYLHSTFVVNSILHTRRGWLNCEVNTFNYMMYQLACVIPNLEFLDSHAALTASRSMKITFWTNQTAEART